DGRLRRVVRPTPPRLQRGHGIKPWKTDQFLTVATRTPCFNEATALSRGRRLHARVQVNVWASFNEATALSRGRPASGGCLCSRRARFNEATALSRGRRRPDAGQSFPGTR